MMDSRGRTPEGILVTLGAAIRAGSTLAWCLEHAPDGDVDALIARAWNEASCELAMTNLGSWANSQRVLVACSGFPLRSLEAADAIRRSIPAPTLAELLEGPVRDG